MMNSLTDFAASAAARRGGIAEVLCYRRIMPGQ
jgi:hypothetical protein